MKVIATQTGYFGKLRYAGEVFEVPEGTTGTWFKPEDEEEPAKRKPGRPAKSAEE